MSRKRRVERPPLVSPRGMPDLRAALAAVESPAQDEWGLALVTLADPNLELFWVTPEMTTVAAHAAGSLPQWTPAAVWPSRSGLLIWDGQQDLRMPAVVADGLTAAIPVAGALWGVHAGHLWVWTVVRADDMVQAVRAYGRLTGQEVFIGPAATLPLMPGAHATPLSVDLIVTQDRLVGPSAPLFALLVSTWLMMQQPTISTPRTITPKGQAYHRAAARDLPIPTVRLVDLRAVRHPIEQTGGGDEHEARIYHRRWLVRGHWRQQACGPKRSQRRPVWIAPHVKGPDDAPLVVSEHVNVWRR